MLRVGFPDQQQLGSNSDIFALQERHIDVKRITLTGLDQQLVIHPNCVRIGEKIRGLPVHQDRQIVRHGVLPQIAPDLARDTLFRFEMNLRESLVLGLVGAGGIGFYIQMYARSFHYEKVATLTLVVLVMVVAIEQFSVFLRGRLR